MFPIFSTRVYIEKPQRVRYAKAYTNAVKNLVWTSASAKKQQILNGKIFPLDIRVLLIDEREFTHICYVCQEVSRVFFRENSKLT